MAGDHALVYTEIVGGCLYMISCALSRDEIQGGIILMYRNKPCTRLKRKFTAPVKKLNCWLQDLVVEKVITVAALTFFSFQI